MEAINMTHHNFQKENLVTTSKGDKYKCKSCGVTGYRMGLAPAIEVSDKEYKKSLKCPLLAEIKTVSISEFLTKPAEKDNHTYIVIKSPWKDRLPVGTPVKRADPRPDKEHLNWFIRVDGKLLFSAEESQEDADGKFVLHSDEYELKS